MSLNSNILQDGFRWINHQIENQNPSIARAFHAFENFTGIRKRHVTIAVVGLMALYIGTSFFAGVVADLACLAFPTYSTIKAIESTEEEQMRRWLMYWVVYNFVSTFEYCGNIVLSLIPAFNLMKLMFLIWCMSTYTHGASLVYFKFVRPFVLRHQDQVDSVISKAASQMPNFGDKDAKDKEKKES